jgi:hypothetical protein
MVVEHCTQVACGLAASLLQYKGCPQQRRVTEKTPGLQPHCVCSSCSPVPNACSYWWSLHLQPSMGTLSTLLVTHVVQAFTRLPLRPPALAPPTRSPATAQMWMHASASLTPSTTPAGEGMGRGLEAGHVGGQGGAEGRPRAEAEVKAGRMWWWLGEGAETGGAGSTAAADGGHDMCGW